MSPALLFIVLLLGVAHWRHVASALAAGAIVLARLGVVYVVITLAATSSGGNPLLV
jgi:hypothetical protein